MFRSIAILMTVVMLAMAPVAAFADSVGYVELPKIFMNYKKAQDAQKKLKKEQEDYKKEFEKFQKDIDKAREDGKKGKAIQKMIEKMEKKLKPKKEQLIAMNQQLTQDLQRDIVAAIKKEAKSYGIDTVLDKQVVLTGGFDLTPFVLERLNKK